MLRELSREEQPDGGLDFSRAESSLLVIADESGGLEGDALKDIIDERVHDRHAALGNSSLRVNLLQHSVDVDAEGFCPLLLWDLLVFLLLSLLG